MASISLKSQDVLSFARDYTGEPFHALLCDPPYEYGFMGKSWDASGVTYRAETWAALAGCLHPGAFGMAFGGARTWHRLAVAIEDAGLRIHPSIFGWAYGSGFPKATRIDTQIDKAAGAEREVVGQVLTSYDGIERKPNTEMKKQWGKNAGSEYNGWGTPVTEPATDLAKSWQSHRYGLQALKPALEPIIVFQKPYDGKPVDSIVGTGAGALNIEGSRIGTETIATHSRGNCTASGKRPGERSAKESGRITPQNRPEFIGRQRSGRWPANFALSHHPDCERVGEREVSGSNFGGGGPRKNAIYGKDARARDAAGYANADGQETIPAWRCVDGCPVRRLGEQSGESTGTLTVRRNIGVSGKGWKSKGYSNTKEDFGYTDTGTAARFFYNADYMLDRLENADPVKYQAKAARKERDAGLGRFGIQIVQTGCGGDFPVDDKGKQRDRFKAQVRNPHPCCKPIALARWLATLLLPPDAYTPRRLLVPFSGSGSEICGAILAGFEEIVGIEMEEEYVEISVARCRFWETKMKEIGSSDPRAILKTCDKRGKGKQGSAVHLPDESLGQIPLEL